MVKKYASSQELQRKLHNGVNILADNVAVTLGPRGRNVLLAKKPTLLILKIRLKMQLHNCSSRLRQRPTPWPAMAPLHRRCWPEIFLTMLRNILRLAAHQLSLKEAWTKQL